MGSRLFAGVIILLTYIVIRLFIPLLAESVENPAATSVPGCSVSDNVTTCQEVGKTTFLHYIYAATVGSIKGAPFVFNFFYVLISGAMIVMATILIATSFVPTLSE